jgi:hypothetical protein
MFLEFIWARYGWEKSYQSPTCSWNVPRIYMGERNPINHPHALEMFLEFIWAREFLSITHMLLKCSYNLYGWENSYQSPTCSWNVPTIYMGERIPINHPHALGMFLQFIWVREFLSITPMLLECSYNLYGWENSYQSPTCSWNVSTIYMGERNPVNHPHALEMFLQSKGVRSGRIFTSYVSDPVSRDMFLQYVWTRAE